MKRLLKLLVIATLLLPLVTGSVAVISGFGDPWGMGARNPWGVFITAALPFLVPGFSQVFAWPLTFGIAILLSPLALFRKRMVYLIAILLILAPICGAWLLGWMLAPDYLDTLFGGRSYVPGRLDSGTWKFGVYLLTDAAVLQATVGWWFWRERASNPPLQRTAESGR